MTSLFESDGSSGAVLSRCGAYRYELWRTWNNSLRAVSFIMLNPSTADAEVDDPTIRRCRSFAEAWGFGGIRVVNLYGYRSPDPQQLLLQDDAVGPFNDEYIGRLFCHSGLIVAAWGAHKAAKVRALDVLALAGGRLVHCLAVNKDGSPKHPLYCRSDACLSVYSGGPVRT